MQPETFPEIKKILQGLKENVPLSVYTTFKIGGLARYFFIAKDKKALITAAKTAKKLNLPFFILGGGSNSLIFDDGFKGLVIKTQNSKIKIINSGIIYAEAGAKLNDLVLFSAKKSLGGLEWAAGIPGTIGGAVYGNSGWPVNKKSISAVVKSVEVLDLGSDLKIRKISSRNCRFGYRQSIFKHNRNLIILGVYLKLHKGDKGEIKEEIARILKNKKEKTPPGFSAGSVFKNPPGNHAGFLIEKCGLKGKKMGGAVISEKHANFIINLGAAKSKDVAKLIDIAKQKVKRKFGIQLEEEIQFIN